MNKQRRKELSEINSMIEAVKEMLVSVLYDEQGSYNNIPESLQGSEKAQESETAIDHMESALEGLDSAIEGITEAIG